MQHNDALPFYAERGLPARSPSRGTARALGESGIFAWGGNYYAITLMERLGLEERGGALRIGLAHYNIVAEVDRIIAALREIARA